MQVELEEKERRRDKVRFLRQIVSQMPRHGRAEAYLTFLHQDEPCDLSLEELQAILFFTGVPREEIFAALLRTGRSTDLFEQNVTDFQLLSALDSATVQQTIMLLAADEQDAWAAHRGRVWDSCQDGSREAWIARAQKVDDLAECLDKVPLLYTDALFEAMDAVFTISERLIYVLWENQLTWAIQLVRKDRLAVIECRDSDLFAEHMEAAPANEVQAMLNGL